MGVHFATINILERTSKAACIAGPDGPEAAASCVAWRA